MACTHMDTIKIKDVKPGSKGCEECLKTEDIWVHLRICLTCGHVGCCNQSKNKHAKSILKRRGTLLFSLINLVRTGSIVM